MSRVTLSRIDSAVGFRQGNRMCLQPAWCALERDDAVLELACFPGQASLVQIEISRAVVGMEHVEQRLPAHIVERVGFDHLQAGAVHVEQPAVFGNDSYAFRLAVEDGTQPCFTRSHCLLRNDAFGHIVGDDKPCVAAVKRHRVRGDFDQNFAAVFPPMQPGLERQRAHTAFREDSLQLLHFFCRTNVGNRHRQELVAAITVMFDGRLVDIEKFKTLDIVNPHR
jgi:hypothetical protein